MESPQKCANLLNNILTAEDMNTEKALAMIVQTIAEIGKDMEEIITRLYDLEVVSARHVRKFAFQSLDAQRELKDEELSVRRRAIRDKQTNKGAKKCVRRI